MSFLEEISVQCQKCGNKFSVEVLKDINITRNPELKEKILKGEFNKKKCDICGASHQIIDSFNYRDEIKKIIIRVSLSREVDSTQKEKIIQNFQQYIKETNYILKDYKSAVVFSIKELKEKLSDFGESPSLESKPKSGKSKLKIYGEKEGFKGFIATIFIDEKNNIIVETDDKKLKEELLKEISRIVEGGGFFLLENYYEYPNYKLLGTMVYPNTHSFLFALKNSSFLWQENIKYGEYKIYGFLSELIIANEEVKKEIPKEFILGEARLDKNTKKFNILVYKVVHKESDYGKHIQKQTLLHANTFIFARTLINRFPRVWQKWKKYYYDSKKNQTSFINNYAIDDPFEDFIESFLEFNNNPKFLEKCNKDKFIFFEEFNKRDRKITSLEKFLKLKFPETYREFLLEFGSGYKIGFPIAGIPKVYGLPANSHHSSVLGATMIVRVARPDIPPNFVTIRFMGNQAICLDLREKPTDDAPLVKINLKKKGSQTINLNQTFSEYLKSYRKDSPGPQKKILYAHSGQEEHLYLLTRICSKCGRKGIFDSKSWVVIKSKGNKYFEKCMIKCRNCAHQEIILFDISSFYGEGEERLIKNKIINESKNPSRIIDIVDYTNLALFYFDRLKVKLKQKTDDKTINFFAKMAKGCIQEALKFYGESTILDEEKSLFSEESRNIYKNNKDAFSLDYLKYQRYKICVFLNNLETMKEIYDGLTGDSKKDMIYLRNLKSKYKNNKEVLGEIGYLMGKVTWKLLTPEEKKKWVKLHKKSGPLWKKIRDWEEYKCE